MDKQGSYHHGDLRRALIDASLALIERGGLQALSLRKAAKQAGVSPGAPYHHFPNRSALFAAIAVEGFELLKEAMTEAHSSATTADERLRACGLAYVAFARRHPAHFAVMFRPELAEHAEHPELQEVAGATLEVLARTIVQGQVEGSVPDGERDALVLLSWSAVHGLASLMIDGPLLSPSFEKLAIDEERMTEVFVATLSALLRGAAAASSR